MTAVLFLGFGFGFGTVAAWQIRGLLATFEMRDCRAEADDLTKVLDQAMEDRLDAHDRWAAAEYRAVCAEQRLRETGLA